VALGGQRRPSGLKQPPMDGDVSERDYLTWLSGRLAGITRYDLSDDDRDAHAVGLDVAVKNVLLAAGLSS